MVKVALITGGNTGVGLAVAERLLSVHPGIEICLACRNPVKAEAARTALRLSHPSSKIETVIMDVGKVESVNNGIDEIKHKYNHLDLVYCNAGTMSVTGVDFKAFLTAILSGGFKKTMYTGLGILKHSDKEMENGLQEVFSTNVFGHFILTEELEPILGGTDQSSQIIWTSSNSARKEAFCIDNIQHINGKEAYSSSKYAVDLLSVAINERKNKKGIYSHSASPGLVMSNMTYGILPEIFWTIMLPLLWLLRFIIPTLTLTPYNGSESLVWLSTQKPVSLDPLSKYNSHVTVLGSRSVKPVKMDVDSELSNKTYEKLLKLKRAMS